MIRMKEFSIIINGHPVGPGHPTYVIAEVGSNHNQQLEMALRYIDEFARAGANAVKFQVFSADTLVNPVLRPDFHKIIHEYSIPREWLPILSTRAKDQGVDLIATPFDHEAVQVLQAVGVPAFKIASSDLTNWPLLKTVAATSKPIILSTGLAYLGEIETAVRSLRIMGVREVAVLHCIGAYPTVEKDVNLRVIPLLQQMLKVPVGFSDHTLGLGASVASVALGACIIEKHVTFDRKQEGPDHSFALELDEFRLMVKLIRQAEDALGEDVKRLVQDEVEDRERARRGIYARNKIPAGTQIMEEMLVTLRPCRGIGAEMWENLIGRVARKDIQPYEPLSWLMFEE